MGDHEARGSSSIREAASDRVEDHDDWRDQQITAVEKRGVKTASQGLVPLERVTPEKQDK
jgi:hypothetical protein